jgi:hypothetical protein
MNGLTTYKMRTGTYLLGAKIAYLLRPVHPSVRMYQRRTYYMDFRGISYWGLQ